MSKSLKNLFISMEEEGNDINQTTLEVSADNTMEEEVANVTEAGIEVIEAEDDVEELHEIAEGLESIVASLESAVEEGGLDSQAAVFMQHAVDGYTKRVGLEATAIVPSLESFGGASGKAAATTISLEGIKETIQKVWQAIKNAVVKAIAAVKNFFAKIFGGVKKLRSRLAALQKAVDGLGDKKAGGKIKVPSANALRLNGKADGKAIATGLKNTAEMGTIVYDRVTKGASSFYSNVAAKITNAEAIKASKEAGFEAALTEASKPFTNVAKEIVSYGKPMSGDAAFKSGSKEAAGEETSLVIPELKRGVLGKDVAEGLEIDVPSQSELKEMLGSMDSILKLMESKKSTIEGLASAREAAKDKSESFVKMVSTGKFDEFVTNAKVSMALRWANKDVTKPVTSYSSYSFAVVRAGLALVDRSVAAYK